MNMKRIGFFLVLVAGVLAFMLLGSSSKFNHQLNASPQNGGDSMAPDFSLVDLNGKTIHLSDFKGKVVMVNFWATWCPPCRRELPDIGKLREEYKDKEFEVIGIILERNSSQVIQKVEQMKKNYGLNYPMVWGNNEVVASYGGINSIPHTFLIDKNGKIFTDYVGARSYEVFKRDIEAVLK